MADLTKTTAVQKSVPQLTGEMAGVDRTLGKIDTRTNDLEERVRHLREAKRGKCEKEDAELKDIRRELIELQTMHSEAVGARKLLVLMLKRLGIHIDDTVKKSGGRALQPAGGK